MFGGHLSSNPKKKIKLFHAFQKLRKFKIDQYPKIKKKEKRRGGHYEKLGQKQPPSALKKPVHGAESTEVFLREQLLLSQHRASTAVSKPLHWQFP